MMPASSSAGYIPRFNRFELLASGWALSRAALHAALSHYALHLHAALSRCALPLRSPAALSRCALPLRSPAALSRCALPLRSPAALSRCALPLRSPAALSRCALPLRSPAALSHYAFPAAVAADGHPGPPRTSLTSMRARLSSVGPARASPSAPPRIFARVASLVSPREPRRGTPLRSAASLVPRIGRAGWQSAAGRRSETGHAASPVRRFRGAPPCLPLPRPPTHLRNH